MSTLPAEIDFVKNPEASPARMNTAMTSLDARLRALELPAKTFDQVLEGLQAIGLQRITDAILPVYTQLAALASLGALFQAPSSTPVAIGTGAATFVLSTDEKDQFAPCGFLIAVSQADSRNALSGRFRSYDRVSGTLVLDVTIASGAGTPSDWLIMPTVPPFVPATIIDPGSDGTSALSAIPYITDQVIGGAGPLDFDAGTA